MDGESDSSDGVEVLDLTSPHPPPRTRRARTTPALSSPGSSIVSEPVATKKPSEGKQLKAGVNKRGRQEGNDTGLESDSSNDFDLDRWGTQSRVSLKSPAARVSSASLAVDAAETKPHEDRDIQFERACGGPVSMTSIPVSVSGRKITGAGEGKGADKLSVSPYVAATACTTPAEKTAVGVFGADTERTSVVELLSDSEDGETVALVSEMHVSIYSYAPSFFPALIRVCVTLGFNGFMMQYYMYILKNRLGLPFHVAICTECTEPQQLRQPCCILDPSTSYPRTHFEALDSMDLHLYSSLCHTQTLRPRDSKSTIVSFAVAD